MRRHSGGEMEVEDKNGQGEERGWESVARGNLAKTGRRDNGKVGCKKRNGE